MASPGLLEDFLTDLSTAIDGFPARRVGPGRSVGGQDLLVRSRKPMDLRPLPAAFRGVDARLSAFQRRRVTEALAHGGTLCPQAQRAPQLPQTGSERLQKALKMGLNV